VDSNSSVSHAHPSPPVPPCEGGVFRWDLGSPYQTYLFVIHDPISRIKAPFSLLSIDHHNSSIRIRSHRCTGMGSSASIGTCTACQGAGEDIANVKNHAQKSAARMDRAVMTHKQLLQKLEAIERSFKKERLKVCILVVS